MKLYAHRGNIEGRKPELENTINYVNKALKLGYGAELDVWYTPNANKYFLGHDWPNHPIPKEFMEDDRIIVHAKNVSTFQQLLKFKTIHSFFQKDDEVVLTSWGKRLYHENIKGFDYGEDEIYVNLDGSLKHREAYGVITDFPTSFNNCLIKPKDEIFKLLILDVDGVMTDGTKNYDASHNIVSKRYCDRDFTAIKRFQSGGIPVVLLTGCAFNFSMAQARGLAYYNAKIISNQLDKGVALRKICQDYACKAEEVGYIGDDYYDLSLLNLTKWSYCPADAAEIVKKNVGQVLPKRGGEGVVEALYESVKDKLTQRFPYES